MKNNKTSQSSINLLDIIEHVVLMYVVGSLIVLVHTVIQDREDLSVHYGLEDEVIMK